VPKHSPAERPSTASMGNPLDSETEQFVRLLEDPRPSNRMNAARYFLANVSNIDSSVLLRAISQESVPPVKRLLRLALQESQRSRAGNAVVENENGNNPPSGALVMHELEPAVGWLKLAASREIDGYEQSVTRREIDGLQARIAGLIAVLETERAAVDASVVDVELALADAFPVQTSVPFTITSESEDGAARVIETDAALFGVILSNAFANAIDACMALSDAERFVSVTYAISDRSFRVLVVNPTLSRSLAQSEQSVGLTTKKGHKGYGLQIINIAARRLGYRTELDVTSGVATLSVRGKVRLNA